VASGATSRAAGCWFDHGVRHLETIATSLINEPLDQVTEKIITQLTSDSPTDDDIVIICVRYRP
jgi:hypothetical protein